MLFPILSVKGIPFSVYVKETIQFTSAIQHIMEYKSNQQSTCKFP